MSMSTTAGLVDIDGLLDQIGGTGRYQKVLIALIACLFGLNGMLMLSFLFTGRVPTLVMHDARQPKGLGLFSRLDTFCCVGLRRRIPRLTVQPG